MAFREGQIVFLTAIVAMDRKGLIGANGKIPWHLPSDLKRFRRLTMGKPVIMGRKTWLYSLTEPLRGRTNIVLSRNEKFHETVSCSARCPDEAVLKAGEEGYEASIIGGSEVYAAFIGQFHRICLTVVDGDFEGDAYFPLHLLDGRYWKESYADFESKWGDKPASFYYELIEKRQPSKGIHEIWNLVDRKAYEKATGR
jgi:dihydrofolate reductase